MVMLIWWLCLSGDGYVPSGPHLLSFPHGSYAADKTETATNLLEVLRDMAPLQLILTEQGQSFMSLCSKTRISPIRA